MILDNTCFYHTMIKSSANISHSHFFPKYCFYPRGGKRIDEETWLQSIYEILGGILDDVIMKIIILLYIISLWIVKFPDSSLVSRLTDGHGSNRYKPVDYGKLQAFTQIKRAAGERTLHKIEKITEQRKVTKEHNLLQQHKSCWFKEQIRLNSLLKKFQSEIDGLRPDSPLDSSTLKSFFKDLEIYEDILNEEIQEFKKCTIDPIKDLQEDLQFWLSENRERLLLGEYSSWSKPI